HLAKSRKIYRCFLKLEIIFLGNNVEKPFITNWSSLRDALYSILRFLPIVRRSATLTFIVPAYQLNIAPRLL
ncbi:hypothetical protein, partial [Kaistella sp.]|uniref:hypothetical protein n=1 Tax=Kaistella sp. TaxID=2782235 RepID=UPI003C619F6D